MYGEKFHEKCTYTPDIMNKGIHYKLEEVNNLLEKK